MPPGGQGLLQGPGEAGEQMSGVRIGVAIALQVPSCELRTDPLKHLFGGQLRRFPNPGEEIRYVFRIVAEDPL